MSMILNPCLHTGGGEFSGNYALQLTSAADRPWRYVNFGGYISGNVGSDQLTISSSGTFFVGVTAAITTRNRVSAYTAIDVSVDVVSVTEGVYCRAFMLIEAGDFVAFFRNNSGQWAWCERISGTFNYSFTGITGNNLRITYNGTNALMYVNGALLKTVTVAFTNSVQFGLAASEGGTVVYENFAEA